MSIETVEIRAFSGPSVVEINGSDQPAIVEINQGPAGAAGPNEVSSATTTTYDGYLYGDGSTVAGATLATVVQDPDTLVLRDSSGTSDFYSINVNTQDVLGVQATTTIAANNDTSLENNVVFTLPLASGYGAITGNSNGLVDIAHGGTNCNSLAAIRDLLTLGASGTITTSQPLSLTQTWNAAGVTFKGIDVNITDSGPANAASTLMDLRVGGVSKFNISKDGKVVFAGPSAQLGRNIVPYSGDGPSIVGNYTFSVISSSNLTHPVSYFGVGPTGGNFTFQLFQNGVEQDNLIIKIGKGSYIVSESTNTLAQRNGTGAQEFRLYGTTNTAVTEYERLKLKYNSATLSYQIGTEKGGTTTSARPLEFQTDGTTRMTIAATTGVVTATQFSAQVLQTTGNGFYAGETPIRLGVNNAMYFRALGSSDEVSLTTSAGGTNYRDLKLRNLTASGDAEITDSTKGVILKSPDGTRYRITVANGGTLSVSPA